MIGPQPSGTGRLLQQLHERHDAHAAQPAGQCDACLAIALAERARDSLQRIQEMSSKGQFDPAAIAAAVRDGLR